jgi:hypothetical protein
MGWKSNWPAAPGSRQRVHAGRYRDGADGQPHRGADASGDDRSGSSAIADWWQRIQARPGYRTAFSFKNPDTKDPVKR